VALLETMEVVEVGKPGLRGCEVEVGEGCGLGEARGTSSVRVGGRVISFGFEGKPWTRGRDIELGDELFTVAGIAMEGARGS